MIVNTSNSSEGHKMQEILILYSNLSSKVHISLALIVKTSEFK